MRTAFLLLAIGVGAVVVDGQSFCCVQEGFSNGAGCTTVDWCNLARGNCEGDCEGAWTAVGGGGGGGCTSVGLACQPTSPVRCCAPYDCVDVDVDANLGTCGTAAPGGPPPPAPSPPPPPPPTPAAGPTPSPGPARRTYYFGHSLIYHTFTTYPNYNDLSVPYWLHLLGAAAGGEPWLADGEFRTANYPLPAEPNWGWTPSITAWDQGVGGDFASSSFDSVVYTELNYVQYKAPAEPYDYDDPHADTPVESLVRIVDYVTAEARPETPVYLYECWEGMNHYPPTEAQKVAYYDSQGTSGRYHNWWTTLHETALAQRPNANLILVPVGPILTSILSTFLDAVPFEELFEDGAPHGRPTPYFLAASILYVAMTGGRRPDGSYVVPTDGTVHPLVVANYDAIVDFIVERLGASPPPVSPPPAEAPVGPSPVAAPTPVSSPVAPPVAAPSDAGGTPCCVQEAFSGGVGCTTVDWCNQAQSHCEGDCEGSWTVVVEAPTASPPPTSSPAVSSPAVAPVAPPVASPVAAPTDVGGTPCCVQEAFSGGVGCTTVDWCNQAQSHCEGDCEGSWTVVVGAPTSSPPVVAPVAPPVASPVAAAPTAPTDVGGTPCCVQENFSGGVGCTTVDWCNQAQENCEGPCEGAWTAVTCGGEGDGCSDGTECCSGVCHGDSTCTSVSRKHLRTR